MVSSLAGSLAVVSCKEPLKLSLVAHIRSLLAQTQQMDPQTVEHAANALTSDNLDLGCSIIEKAAGDKGIRDIDERLAQAYQVRISLSLSLSLSCSGKGLKRQHWPACQDKMF